MGLSLGIARERREAEMLSSFIQARRSSGEGFTRGILAAVAAAVAIAAASGGGNLASAAPAQPAAPGALKVSNLHAIVRPDASGRWYIQQDHDHAALGVARLEQLADRLHLHFERRHQFAGVIQISSDDEFRNRISGHASLGTAHAVIFVVADGKPVNPADV